MKGLQPTAERTCMDCHAHFLGVAQQLRCNPCRHTRKKVWDTQQHKRTEPILDISENMVELRFQSALAEIRRTKAHRIEEPSWDYRGRYREP